MGCVVNKQVMNLGVGIAFALGFLFAPHVETCSAQVPGPWVAGRAPMQGTFPGYSPPTFNSEFPGPSMPSEVERMRRWEL
jgi:hypothetical protein